MASVKDRIEGKDLYTDESNNDISVRFLVGFVAGGLAADWYCAYQWFSGRYSFWSGIVLYRMVLIVLPCAVLGLLATRLPGKKIAVFVLVFFFSSIQVSGNMLLWWVGHR